MRSIYLLTTAILGLVTTATEAKPARPARRAAPAAAVVPPQPGGTTPAAPGGMMTPKEVRLRPTTPAEAEANAIWSTRAALNIAALQCQFSPALMTVRNYNDFLRQHAEELDRARLTMVAHFKRYDATQAQNSFDRYTTQTYNSFSTLDAQYAFCEEAARAGRMALTIRKGDLGRSAGPLRDRVRTALIPVSPLAFVERVELQVAPLPAF